MCIFKFLTFINLRNVDTAGHCIYAHDLGGFAKAGTIFFGKRNIASGFTFDAIYNLTSDRINNDWINSHNFRSGFGAMKVIHYRYCTP